MIQKRLDLDLFDASQLLLSNGRGNFNSNSYRIIPLPYQVSSSYLFKQNVTFYRFII